MIKNKLNDEFYYHFFNGTLNNAYDYLGAHINDDGCEFLIYAPNANKVCLIGGFNNFIEQEMELINKGFYYININKNILNNEYKYVIYNDKKYYKSDPYAFYSGFRPNNNSIVFDIKNNNEYKRKKHDKINIYEMHIGSWKDRFPNYTNLDIVNYLKEHNFTHVEFLPVYEHPLDESWGYMITGYYSVTSRYGNPNDFIDLVNMLHENDISIILDWVPGHICKDDFGLYKFDGTYLYEYDYEDIRENISWGTANLDFNKKVTQTFLLSNLFFFIKKYNIDGFRVDAVRNLIYYLGDENRGVNHNCINFMRKLNLEVKKYDANILMIAEDSSDYLNVTNELGLAFDYKWNMGWMNDSLKYFQMDPYFRNHHHKLITFSFSYIFKENYILPISHDEVVHLKRSLFNKMPGGYFDKFATLRLFLGYMYTHPGKKLLFMGQEFGVESEWNVNSCLDFNLLNSIHNKKLNNFYKRLSYLYLTEKSLENDDLNSFVFIEPDNNKQSVFVYSRINEEHIIVTLNCLPIHYEEYKVGVFNSNYIEILNSDNEEFGGENRINKNLITVKEDYLKSSFVTKIVLPPLSIVILKNTK